MKYIVKSSCFKQISHIPQGLDGFNRQMRTHYQVTCQIKQNVHCNELPVTHLKIILEG